MVLLSNPPGTPHHPISGEEALISGVLTISEVNNYKALVFVNEVNLINV